MSAFVLDPALERDSFFIADVGLTQMRLMNDRRFPWLILVPKRGGIAEMHELTPLDQTMLTFEVAQVSTALQTFTQADKMNVAALGNQVRQLHVHVIARFTGDAAWPGPVWCAGAGQGYETGEAQSFKKRFSDAF